MNLNERNDGGTGGVGSGFPTTHWSVFFVAGGPASPANEADRHPLSRDPVRVCRRPGRGLLIMAL